MLDLAGKKVLVLGLGKTGRSAAVFCHGRGARVVAADEQTGSDPRELSNLGAGIELRLGVPFPDPADFDLVVPSPGVPPDRYRERAKTVWGDIELLYRASPTAIVAITGTNGKSTTTVMIESMLRAAGHRARAAGNLGDPALGLVGEALDAAVLEVSSFQLETTEAFRPRVAVVLNATPDHLDRHGTFAAYAAAKARIFARQREDDVVVLNFDDEAVRAMADEAPARVLPFRTAGPLQHGAWFDAGSVVLRDDRETLRITLDDAPLPSRAARENAVAALAAVFAFGADPRAAARALATFRGLPHRSEIIDEIGGVTYVNDSKATNPGAALPALTSGSAPLVWIAGGRDKALDFRPLADAAVARARAAILIGEAAEKLGTAIAGRIPVHVEPSLEAAVNRAADLARPGDVVLLSPACASQDQFLNFEDRGDRFRRAVRRIAERGMGS